MISPPPGQQITDEIECPLLELTHVIFLRRSSLILKQYLWYTNVHLHASSSTSCGKRDNS